MPTATAWWQRGEARPLPLMRWRVTGRNHFQPRMELGYFFERTAREAKAECRRRKGHLCGGLELEAEGRL